MAKYRGFKSIRSVQREGVSNDIEEADIPNKAALLQVSLQAGACAVREKSLPRVQAEWLSNVSNVR